MKPDPLLLVYKEILPGDLRKLHAASNDAPTGGGARDLRFPWREFRTVMHRIFSESKTSSQGREIRTAKVKYKDTDGKVRHTELEYWPPTDSRPREDRVAKIHASPAIGGRLPDGDKGRVLLMFIKWSNGEAWCYWAYEGDLRASNKWAEEVRSVILDCIELTEDKNDGRQGGLTPVQGYYDFTNGTAYCYAE